jgi:hypothetical protein
MFASFVAAPLDTVLATRSGHGSTAVKLLRGQLDPDVYQRKSCKQDVGKPTDQDPGRNAAISDSTCYSPPDKRSDSTRIEPCFAHVALRREGDKSFKNVSMSWWLSKPVQKYLDDQFSNSENLAALNRVCDVVSRGGSETKRAAVDLARVCREQLLSLVAR